MLLGLERLPLSGVVEGKLVEAAPRGGLVFQEFFLDEGKTDEYEPMDQNSAHAFLWGDKWKKGKEENSQKETRLKRVENVHVSQGRTTSHAQRGSIPRVWGAAI